MDKKKKRTSAHLGEKQQGVNIGKNSATSVYPTAESLVVYPKRKKDGVVEKNPLKKRGGDKRITSTTDRSIRTRGGGKKQSQPLISPGEG